MPIEIRGLSSRLTRLHRHTILALGTVGVLAIASGQLAQAAVLTDAAGTRIHDIQGATHRSPLAGQQVSDVPGVVTAVGSNGFWLQDAEPDDNPATSEGVFVYTRTAPTVKAADSVTVAGTVSEFRPGNTATNLTTTEITSPTVTVAGSGVPLPGPTQLGPGGATAPKPVRTDSPGDVESAGFDPAANGLDFYESREGMLIRITDSVATGPTTRFGELSVLPGGAGGPRTVRGGIRYSYDDPNTERVILDDVLAKTPTANAGDKLPGNVDGMLDYSFGNYKLLPLAPPTAEAQNLPRESTQPQASNELAVATYNVENLDPTDPQAKFDRLAHGITDNLKSPDIVAIEEIQDNNGATNDGTVDAKTTWGKLIDAIKAAGGPTYDYRQIDPENLSDGGEPGGNIRVGFLLRPDREVTFVDRPGGDATTATDVKAVDKKAELTLSPGRVDPGNAAWKDSRKPLAGQFQFRGKSYIVIANHFNSKGGDQPLMGRYQPPTRSSEEQRHAQAGVLRGFLDKIFAAQSGANVVVLGDINDFEFSDTVKTLVGDGSMVDLPQQLPEAERYSYVFDGNSQILDQILISTSLASRYACDIVHINAEYADQDSDHDPQVVRLGGALGKRH